MHTPTRRHSPVVSCVKPHAYGPPWCCTRPYSLGGTVITMRAAKEINPKMRMSPATQKNNDGMRWWRIDPIVAGTAVALSIDCHRVEDPHTRRPVVGSNEETFLENCPGQNAALTGRTKTTNHIEHVESSLQTPREGCGTGVRWGRGGYVCMSGWVG